MAMTVGELIMELESYDENMEVRLAQQPSWAFEYSIGQVGASDPGELTDEQHCTVRDMTEGDREEAESEGKDFDFDEAWRLPSASTSAKASNSATCPPALPKQSDGVETSSNAPLVGPSS